MHDAPGPCGEKKKRTEARLGIKIDAVAGAGKKPNLETVEEARYTRW